MDEVLFYENVNDWCQNNYPSVNNGIISNVNTIFLPLYHQIESTIGTDVLTPIIDDLKNVIISDPTAIEKSFYDVFKDLRGAKSDSSIVTQASIACKL